MKRLRALEASRPMAKTDFLATPLRTYQKIGVDWIRFLHENGFAGLLCDDMGLGKTHETMAFMVWLRRKQEVRQPFLVVCPTTVISHWRDKIRDHAPELRVLVHHGADREVKDSLTKADVVLTSYGILRIDIVHLRKTVFDLVIYAYVFAVLPHHGDVRYDVRFQADDFGRPCDVHLGGVVVESHEMGIRHRSL